MDIVHALAGCAGKSVTLEQIVIRWDMPELLPEKHHDNGPFGSPPAELLQEFVDRPFGMQAQRFLEPL